MSLSDSANQQPQDVVSPEHSARQRPCSICGVAPRDGARFCDACGAVATLTSGRQTGAMPAAGVGSESERHALTARERKLTGRLHAMAAATVKVAREIDLERLMDEMPGVIQATLGYDVVGVFLVDPSDGGVKLRAGAGIPAPIPRGARMGRGEGIIGRTALTGETYLAADVQADPYYMPGPNLDQTRSELAAPIIGQGGILGVLDVQSNQPAAFDDLDAVTLEALAADLAVAIDNARLVQQARDNEDRLRTMIDAVPHPLSVFGSHGRIILMNRPMRELFHLPRDCDPVGLTMQEVSDLIPPEVHAVTDILDRAPTLPVNRPDEEVHFANPSRTFIRQVTPVVTDRETEAHIILYQEVTAERAALRAKDQLLSIAAHELRTPLTAVLGFIDLIVSQAARPGLDVELLQRRMVTVRREARRLAELVEELLGLAQLEAGETALRPVEVDLGDLIARVIERFGTILDGAERVEVSRARPGEICVWDEGRIEQILIHLIDNALRYSPPNTPVKITIDESAEEAHLVVRDYGAGLSAAELERLFRPFTRIATPELHAGGLGLGLYVSRALAERHGGRLWLESAPGEGVEAHLVLPRQLPVAT